MYNNSLKEKNTPRYRISTIFFGKYCAGKCNMLNVYGGRYHNAYALTSANKQSSVVIISKK